MFSVFFLVYSGVIDAQLLILLDWGIAAVGGGDRLGGVHGELEEGR
jgi:hypothetical protein